jgi:predicted RNA-binding protein YlqC (UPF0109 family)
MLSKAGEEIKGFVDTVVRALVDDPTQVNTSVLESGSMVVVELTVAQSDMGVLIGREGRNAQSLRVLLSALSTKNGKKGILQIIDRRQQQQQQPS